MRSLSAGALTKIAEHYGSEPIVILNISWKDGTQMRYADRTVAGISGKIISISNLDSVIKVSKNDDSQEITVVLDDTDGAIKSIMNDHDIHKRDVWVYQYFEGLPITDAFLLFKGKINSPITWDESARTITIAVVSQLEDKEVGFSPEEGQFPHIPRDLIGKTWPSIFGTPLDVPVVQIGKAVEGTTLCSIGIVTGSTAHNNEKIGPEPPDITLSSIRRNYLGNLATIYSQAASLYWMQPEIAKKYVRLSEEHRDQGNEIAGQITETLAQYYQQLACAEARRAQTASTANLQGIGCNPVRILGGEDFPRGTITLDIDGGLFTGYFEGDSDIFVIESRNHPQHSTDVARAIADRNDTPRACEPLPEPWQFYDWKAEVPPRYSNTFPISNYYVKKFILVPKTKTKKDKMNNIMRHFWAEAGATVTIEGYEPITYIVSIVPGTVLQVKAFKTFNGIQRLVNVPSNMWTTTTQQYGSVTAVQVTISKALSTLEDQNWSDDLYVTFKSDIGPNIVDILTYLIQTYTDLAIDTASFNAVNTKLDKFPANFALLTRKNILTVLNEIAFQARCNLRLVNGVFYLTYLAEEPSTVDTVTLNDIENQSVQVFLTSTEDIVTKYIVKWRLSYAQKDLNQIILRHNVKKYGIQEESYEYYIYNQPDIIHKISTFWLIRKANTWKRIRFKTFFNKLNLETFDPILLNFSGKEYVATNNVKAIIEQANIDGENYTIDIECWLPIKSGEMTPYEFAWPANVSADWIFPTDREVDLGLDGGDGIGRNATGTLPIGDISNIGDQTIYVGGVNIIFGPQTDRGDPHPSDQGFVAQSLNIDETLATVINTVKPNLNLLLNYMDEIIVPPLPPDLPTPFQIILEETPVISKHLDASVSVLSDIIGLNEESNDLVIKTGAKFQGTDGESGCQTAPYHFKYDSVGEVWAAGTAFLREDSETAPTMPTDGELEDCVDTDD